MAVLIGMSEGVKGQTHDVGSEGLTIGRTEENSISIDNPTVSGRHCTITLQGDEYILKDLGSTNGTLVNAEEVTEVILKPNDLIRVGSVEFLFSSEEIPLSEAEAIYSKTEVVEASEPAEMPQAFESISPFGARRRERRGLWSLVIALTGILAVVMVGLFLYQLFAAS